MQEVNRRPVDQEQSSGCLACCLARIWTCLVNCFRALFGTPENTRRSSIVERDRIPAEEITRPPQVVPMQIEPAEMQQAQAKLEEGVDIGAIPVEKLNFLVSKIQATCLGAKNEQDDDIIWYNSSEFVFSFKSISNLMFKIYRPGMGTGRGNKTLWGSENAEARYTNMVKAQAVCTKLNLHLIVIPHAKKITVDKEIVIVEERVNINDPSARETLYTLPGLDETIRQFATFIAETQFNDVKLNNIALLDVDPTFMGSRRIALFDLEHMESASEGFYGAGLNGSSGLIGCLFTQQQIDIALKVAKRYGYTAKTTSGQMKEQRMLDVQRQREWYALLAKEGRKSQVAV